MCPWRRSRSRSAPPSIGPDHQVTFVRHGAKSAGPARNARTSGSRSARRRSRQCRDQWAAHEHAGQNDDGRESWGQVVPRERPHHCQIFHRSRDLGIDAATGEDTVKSVRIKLPAGRATGPDSSVPRRGCLRRDGVPNRLTGWSAMRCDRRFGDAFRAGRSADMTSPGADGSGSA